MHRSVLILIDITEYKGRKGFPKKVQSIVFFRNFTYESVNIKGATVLSLQVQSPLEINF